MSEPSTSRLPHFVTRHPSVILFAVQLLGVLLYPFTDTYVFSVLQQLQHGCFLTSFSDLPIRSWNELLFLSFTNLSSTGISDIAPVTGQARSVVMIEQIAGVAYVAVFVSRMVGLTPSRQVARRRAETANRASEND